MKININNIKVLVTLAVSMLTLNACAPRGETEALSDILTQSRDRFRAAEIKVGDSPVRAQLSQVAQQLVEIEKIQNPGVLKPATNDLKNTLAGLLPHAGYTVRPALSEIVSQYQALANGSAVTTDSTLAGSPEIRLLLVRTYSILASELETGKFSL